MTWDHHNDWIHVYQVRFCFDQSMPLIHSCAVQHYYCLGYILAIGMPSAKYIIHTRLKICMIIGYQTNRALRRTGIKLLILLFTITIYLVVLYSNSYLVTERKTDRWNNPYQRWQKQDTNKNHHMRDDLATGTNDAGSVVLQQGCSRIITTSYTTTTAAVCAHCGHLSIRACYSERIWATYLRKPSKPNNFNEYHRSTCQRHLLALFVHDYR